MLLILGYLNTENRKFLLQVFKFEISNNITQWHFCKYFKTVGPTD